MCVSQPSDRGARVELADIIIIIILLFHFIIGFLAKLWPNIRPYLGLLKYLIVSLDRSPILLRVISWLHKVANYFKWILSIPNNQLTFSQRSECKLEESVYDKWLLTIFVSCYPLIPPAVTAAVGHGVFSGCELGASSWESEDKSSMQASASIIKLAD